METNKMNTTNLSEFTENMKNTDSRYAQIVKGVQLVYYVIIPVYIILIIIQLFTQASLYDVGGSFCILISMLIFALLLRNYYKEYNYVDYAQPTLIMLKNAAKRYKPFRRKSLWVLFAVTFLGFGMVFMNREFDIIIVISVYGGLMLVSAIAGLIWWYVQYKPLRDAALQLIAEIEGLE